MNRRAGRPPGATGTTPPALLDSHVHFWDRRRLDYEWLSGEGGALHRDFLPADLIADLATAAELHLAGVVFVQADCRPEQGIEEVAWVQGLAAAGAAVLAVVAHAPLETGGACASVLEDLISTSPLVSGVRRLLQDEPPGFVTDPSLVTGVRLLAGHGLTMDLCVRQHQLAEVVDLVERCPDVEFVLDHLGKPRIDDAQLGPWADQLTRLAARPNVRCKLSGLMTEASPGRRTAAALRPWLEHALETFGPARCMFGSDWPVLTGVAGYAEWYDIVLETLAPLSDDERRCVLSATATDTYDPVNRAARAKDS